MENITLSVDDEGIALLVLNRPQALNALNVPLMQELRAALEDMAADDSVRVLIITGSGRAFCAGADLTQNALRGDEGASIGELVADSMKREFNPMMEMIYAFPRPVVTALNGIAAGGGAGLALCADLVIASEQAAIKVVQVQQLGIAADLGANWLLQRIAGRGRALAACLLADTIPAATLQEWGMVWECVPADQLLDRARDQARKLAQVPAETVLATRALVDDSSACTYIQSLEQERQCQQKLCNAPVFMELVGQFVAKK
ncbi:MAG: enoyl-CoA hydratase/isomerase family protein [Halieaceae bacterium]|jgi:2-(1,2-epoxy-1,2-dihydrophenyl)acetyl-CoA isomerase|nr:enoyl-CoA hydratase/isomerase family protein [Halieaceae bacterium]